ncbi:MAG: hypothetical protein KY439_00885 [Actinobacteria bacterium]|nr:hypothetical protein [Actinomycetota bacterium]
MDDAVMDRLREHAEHRLVAIPDTDGEVQAALWRLDELLGLVAAWEEEQRDHGAGAGQLAVGPSREAVSRLATAVRKAEAKPPAQPVAPDGRYELVPVAWAVVERADLVQLGLAARALGQAWALRHDELVADALAEMAGTDGRKPEDLVAEAARLQGLLSLAWDGDVSQLARALPAHGGRVVLTPALHGAYQRLVDRILAIWHAGDPLAPFLYRGDR